MAIATRGNKHQFIGKNWWEEEESLADPDGETLGVDEIDAFVGKRAMQEYAEAIEDSDLLDAVSITDQELDELLNGLPHAAGRPAAGLSTKDGKLRMIPVWVEQQLRFLGYSQ